MWRASRSGRGVPLDSLGVLLLHGLFQEPPNLQGTKEKNNEYPQGNYQISDFRDRPHIHSLCCNHSMYRRPQAIGEDLR